MSGTEALDRPRRETWFRGNADQFSVLILAGMANNQGHPRGNADKIGFSRSCALPFVCAAGPNETGDVLSVPEVLAQAYDCQSANLVIPQWLVTFGPVR